MRAFAPLATVALTIAMGVHVLRAYLAMVVWNVAEERSQVLLALIALAIWGAGLAGWLLAPRPDPMRSARKLAVMFTVVYAFSHLIADPVLTPAAALISVVVWLWFVPGLVENLARCSALGALAPGILVGFAIHVALQTALHGLDMPMLRGALPGLGATLLGSALVASTFFLRPGADGQSDLNGPRSGWGMIALGPYFALQLTLLANLGRVQMLSGWDAPPAALFVLLGFAAGVAVQPLARLRAAHFVAGVIPPITVIQPHWLRSDGMWLMVATQLLLAIALAAALAPSRSTRLGRPFLPGAIGMLFTFGFILLFYARYEWVAIWPLMAALAAAPAIIWGQRAMALHFSRIAAAIIIIGAVGTSIGLRAAPSRSAATVSPAAGQLRVITYNIHMGFDGYSVPDPIATARVIERSGADLVALQEVGRGWTVNGGADLAAWLRWRFPQYHLIYGPMNGDLWGNVILSRLHVRGQGVVRFPLRQSRFQRGLTWAAVSTGSGELLIVNVHLAHGASSEDRVAQAADILAFLAGRKPAVVLGDFNASPDSDTMDRLRKGGLIDAFAPHGLDTAFTYSATKPYERRDYILISRDVQSLSAAIVSSTASDHLPLVAEISVP